jgi:hypothetical protein
MTDDFTPDDARRWTEHLRPFVESRSGVKRLAGCVSEGSEGVKHLKERLLPRE